MHAAKIKINDLCPFCEIISGKAKSSKVYEDTTVLAFMDINPTNIGHTLVIPREHWENIFEVPEEILSRMATIVKKISIAVKKAIFADGIRIIQLNGKVAGQVIMHIHIHIIPVFLKYESTLGYSDRLKPERKELDKIAEKIRENL